MMTLSVVGVQINILLLLFIGLAVGILSGFIGVGGGYLVTPALIILGLPANLAVGALITQGSFDTKESFMCCQPELPRSACWAFRCPVSFRNCNFLFRSGRFR